MKFIPPLVRGTLLQRYKRFLADVRLDSGETITASCPNTGAMLGVTAPGTVIWLSVSDAPQRKYRHTWELAEVSGSGAPVLVGINTGRPNALISDAVAAGRIAELSGYAAARREVRYGANSRIDLLLEKPGRPLCYVEIKSAHLMRQEGLAEFPDCRSERAAKHLAELSAMVAEGSRAVMIFCVQRADAGSFAVAADLDPNYGTAFSKACRAGVEMLAYTCDVSAAGIDVTSAIPIVAVS